MSTVIQRTEESIVQTYSEAADIRDAALYGGGGRDLKAGHFS